MGREEGSPDEAQDARGTLGGSAAVGPQSWMPSL